MLKTSGTRFSRIRHFHILSDSLKRFTVDSQVWALSIDTEVKLVLGWILDCVIIIIYNKFSYPTGNI